jgi:hypothetical protein
MTALHQFGAEMLKLSRGLESFTSEPRNVEKNIDADRRRRDIVTNIDLSEQPKLGHDAHKRAKSQ